MNSNKWQAAQIAARVRMTQSTDTIQGAELCVQNARVLNVFSGKIMENVDVLMGNGTVLGFAPKGTGKAKQILDAQEKYMLPGLIDAHVHIESSMVSPEQFAALVLPHGTTSIVADPHEIANVLGLTGIRYMMQSAAKMPLNVRFMLPSCVPATPFENAGATLTAKDLEELMPLDSVQGLAEMMNFPGVAFADEDVMAKLALAKRYQKTIDGHAPLVSGQALDCYCGSGIATDHECSTLEEMQGRIERGMYVLIRQGSAAHNLQELIKGVTPDNACRCCFCCDDASPDDIAANGHMERHLRMAVAAGVAPVTAVRMATLYPAQCYNMLDKGAIAPGYDADFVLVDNLHDFTVQAVFMGAKKIAEAGKLEEQFVPKAESAEDEKTAGVAGAMHVAPLTEKSFDLPLPNGRARVIGLKENQLVTDALEMDVETTDGMFDAAKNPALCKVAVIERHNATGNVGVGLLHGYTDAGKRMHGAVATTISHDSHNIVVAGDNDEDMIAAVQELVRMGGGICLVRDGKVLESLALPIAGLMSPRPAQEVAAAKQAIRSRALSDFAIHQGVEPIMTLSFMALVVIPDLRISDQGLFDVREFHFVPTAL